MTRRRRHTSCNSNGSVGGVKESNDVRKRPKSTSTKRNTPPDGISLRNVALFSLKDLTQATLVSRPSKRNRSPFVGDIYLETISREAICHVPNLDMGGKCIPGAALLVKRAKDKKGQPVGPDAVNKKYGTPKCEYIAQLLRVDESRLSPLYSPTYVGAHPSLGELIAKEWLVRNLLDMPPVSSMKTQVTIASSRFDFLVTHEDGSQRIVEVKTVVDTDYSAEAPPPTGSLKCCYLSTSNPYSRTAIFPWGQSRQKGPEGECVISSRAIQHVRHLTQLRNETDCPYLATILFVVVRGDVTYFRPNHEACPTFVKYLQEAKHAGVQILAKRVRWGENESDLGVCYSDEDLQVLWPTTRHETKV